MGVCEEANVQVEAASGLVRLVDGPIYEFSAKERAAWMVSLDEIDTERTKLLRRHAIKHIESTVFFIRNGVLPWIDEDAVGSDFKESVPSPAESRVDRHHFKLDDGLPSRLRGMLPKVTDGLKRVLGSGELHFEAKQRIGERQPLVACRHGARALRAACTSA